jgi:hypothetical protein
VVLTFLSLANGIKLLRTIRGPGVSYLTLSDRSAAAMRAG